MTRANAGRTVVVRGTEILPADPLQRYREKIARVTLDSMVQFVGLLDAHGTVLEINKVALDAVGITLADVEGKPFWTTYWWQVSNEINAELRELIARAAKGELVRWETEIYGRAGGKETVIIDASLTPVVDDAGKVVFICAEWRDITEKKAHERLIAEKNIALLGLLERIRELGTPLALETGTSLDRATPDAVVEELRPAGPARHPGQLVEAGPGAGGRAQARPRVLVVEDNADMNRFVTACLSRDYDVVQAFDGREGLEKALRFRPTLVVSDIMMPEVSGVEMIGEMRRLPELQSIPILLLSARADEELSVKLLEEGARDSIVKPFSGRELAARVRNLVLAHQASQEAELQRRLLCSLFDQAPMLILVLRGPEHVIELANPPVCRVFRHTREEMVDRPLFDLLPHLRDQVFPALLEGVYRTGVPHVGRETPARFDRGAGIEETVYFDFVYAPFRNVDGRIEGVFVIASDVTEQVLARHQIDELRRTAEGASRAKDEFLAMLGHELRNPLSPILTALELMKLRGETGSQRERTVIERQVSHLTRLVDDLLDVSRIARGKVELKTEIVEMADVVAKAIEMASPLLEQRAHMLAVDIPAHGLRVDGDATRLSQVVSNLLTNAAKYTPHGGRISIRAEQLDGSVVLSVRDTGIGISPEMLPRIFDLFVQERQALDRSQGGLGIGLTIVRSLVERHGGSVAVRSDGPGKGSEFIIRLPAAARADEAAPAMAARAETLEGGTRPAGTTRILIVDDNEDGAEMLARALTGKGYDTRVAHDGPTALRVAARFAPHLAFLDVGLPVMDGYELASHLRKIPGLENLRLIAVTGYGQASDRRRSREAGFQHHLVKPVDLNAIEATLQNLE